MFHSFHFNKSIIGLSRIIKVYEFERYMVPNGLKQDTRSVSLSAYLTEGSGKTRKEIKETAHTLDGYIECEPMRAYTWI